MSKKNKAQKRHRDDQQQHHGNVNFNIMGTVADQTSISEEEDQHHHHQQQHLETTPSIADQPDRRLMSEEQHEVSTGRPPCPSQFTDIPDADWTEEVWAAAERAALLFPSKEDRDVLVYFVGKRYISSFKKGYYQRWNELPVTGLSPREYFKHCIEKKMKGKVIIVKSSEMTSQFVASAEAARLYNNRRIFTGSEPGNPWTMEPLGAVVSSTSVREVLLPSKIDDDKKLYIVSGESGIGKTTFGLMTAELGICVTPHDINEDVMKSLSGLGKTGRDDNVLNAVKVALTSILDGMFDDKYVKLDDAARVTISLMLDEFGQYPAFVRAMCAVQGTVRTHIESLIPFAVKTNILVIGTGTDLNSDGIGSLPHSYVPLRMPTAALMKKMTTALTKRYGDRAATLVNALESHGQAQHLICNPRFAACLFKRLVDFCDSTYTEENPPLFPSEDAAQLALDMHLIVSARDYKLLNGMSNLGKAAVMRCYKIALELLLRDVQDKTALTLEEFCLFSRQGVLTDCSKWVPRAEEKSYPDHVAIRGRTIDDYDPKGNPVSMILIAPRTGVYAMSMAQQLLFRMCYGFHVLETAASWQRYEVQIAEHTTMLLCGLEGRPLRDLLGRLGTLKRAGKKRAAAPKKEAIASTKQKKATAKQIACAKMKQKTDDSRILLADPIAIAKVQADALDMELKFDHVVTVHSKKQIKPETSPKVVQVLYDACRGNREEQQRTAVVIVNGSSAPYADVIVVIPMVAVILVQCKFYGQQSKFDVDAEATKLKGEVGALNGFAHVPKGAYFRVLATSKELDEDIELSDFYHLDTTSPTALAPLFTPIHEPVVPAKKHCKVVRSMEARNTHRR